MDGMTYSMPLRLNDHLGARLAAHSSEIGESRNAIVSRALLRYLDQVGADLVLTADTQTIPFPLDFGPSPTSDPVPDPPMSKVRLIQPVPAREPITRMPRTHPSARQPGVSIVIDGAPSCTHAKHHPIPSGLWVCDVCHATSFNRGTSWRRPG